MGQGLGVGGFSHCLLLLLLLPLCDHLTPRAHGHNAHVAPELTSTVLCLTITQWDQLCPWTK